MRQTAGLPYTIGAQPASWKSWLTSLLSLGVFEGDQAIGNGEFRQAGDRVDIQAAHNSFAVCFDSAHANAKLAGNLFIAAALRDQNENLALAGRQLSKRFLFAAVIDQLIERCLGNLRTEESLSLVHRL